MAKKPAETETAVPAAETVTKTEAVRRAIADGVDSPAEGAAYIKDKFGLDITNQQFSTYKSIAKKKSGVAPARRGPKPGRKITGVENVLKPREAAPNGHREGNGKAVNAADLARAVKQLVSEYGADAVREMTSVFAE